jgi:polysaccharide pyruvyl transferase WcaK-like protein
MNNMKSLRVGLVGYYGWGNYGDEFFKKVLDDKLVECNFEVLHEVGPDGALNLDNLEKRVASVDVIMVGGGDLVIPFALSRLYWRPEFLKRPVIIYGVGVPRWGGYDEKVVAAMKEFFQHSSVKQITARDDESREWISTHLKPSAPVSTEPDIVCAYKHPYMAPGRRLFGLVLRHQSEGVDNKNVKLLLDQVRGRGYHPRILMLATDSTLRSDFETVARLDLGDADIVIRSSLEAITDELLVCDRVASMKFHGCVVALSHDIPCLALSAANKFKNFYAELERSDWVSYLKDQKLKHKLDLVLDTPNFSFPNEIKEKAIEGLANLQESLKVFGNPSKV